ncbi:MAG: hypothetical protein EBR82_27090 [Caulobacteraceae bacterium]|nr:hypothetical protein [Caulobacteraceae bacterium]
MKNLSIFAALNLKAAAAGKPRRFSILAYSGGTLNVDGFDLPVIVDLAGMEIPASVPILIDHTKSVEATLGLTDSIVNTGTSLMLAGLVTGQSATSQQVLAQAAAGHQWQASIGAMVGDTEEIAAGQSVEVNGQSFTGPVIVARRSVLRETSVLPMGADPTTSVNLAAKAAGLLKGAAPMSFEQWCTSLGVDPATLDEANKAAMQLAFDAAQNPPATPPATPAPVPAAAAVPTPAPALAPTASAGGVLNLQAALKQQNEAFASNLRRVSEIQAKAAGHPSIAATAIEKGWSLEKVELEVLKASDAKVRPTSFKSGEKSVDGNLVLEAALCQHRKLPNIEKSFAPEVLQAAHTEYRGQIGLQQMLIMAAEDNGLHLQAGTRLNAGNIRGVLQAAFSTAKLPGILSNTANKEILQGYMEEDAIWREIAQIKSVNDFKTVTSYRMLDDMAYEKIGAGDTIKGGKVSEESFTRAVDTYAKMFSLTRTDIINDDLGAFDDLRTRIGAGAAIKLNDLFWTTFLANVGTIFTTARLNYISGSTTNLGTDGVGLGLAQKAWRQRRSPTADGTKRVGGQAKFLLVPPELETIADALYVARNPGSVKVSDVNTFAGKYLPIVANQLSDSAYTGYSTTAFYLLGDKSKGAPVVVSFLGGQETPTVESTDADFNTLGIQFRGYHDFGCDLGDGYLNALMSKGAA